jgi:hypothetical protein
MRVGHARNQDIFCKNEKEATCLRVPPGQLLLCLLTHDVALGEKCIVGNNGCLMDSCRELCAIYF